MLLEAKLGVRTGETDSDTSAADEAHLDMSFQKKSDDRRRRSPMPTPFPQIAGTLEARINVERGAEVGRVSGTNNTEQQKMDLVIDDVNRLNRTFQMLQRRTDVGLPETMQQSREMVLDQYGGNGSYEGKISGSNGLVPKIVSKLYNLENVKKQFKTYKSLQTIRISEQKQTE